MTHLELYIHNNYTVLHDFCDFLDARNDTTEKFAERSGRREFCSRLCGLSRAGMLPCTRATRIFSVLQVFIHVAPIVARRIPSRTH